MPSKIPLIIVGGGGFGREVIWLANESSCPHGPYSSWDVKGILDDTPEKQGKVYCNVPVIGTIMDWKKYEDAYFVIAVGSPRGRRSIADKMSSLGNVKFATLIHTTVQRSEYVSIGEGSMITAGCILTTQIKLGKHTICNLATTIGHDVATGDFCTFAPHVAVSGNVTLGDGVQVGTGALLLEERTLGRGCFIGAGSVVTKDIPENVLAVGSPARKVKELDPF